MEENFGETIIECFLEIFMTDHITSKDHQKDKTDKLNNLFLVLLLRHRYERFFEFNSLYVKLTWTIIEGCYFGFGLCKCDVSSSFSN